MLRTIKNSLKNNDGPLFRVLMIPVPLTAAIKYTGPSLGHALACSVRSREDTNYTYELNAPNLGHLAHVVSVVSGKSADECMRFIDEALADVELRRHIIDARSRDGHQFDSDPEPRFARRLGWYALVRLTRPKWVVETGVDKGLGSVLLCSALLRNAAEGFPGEYCGTDINPKAGWLLTPPYAGTGRIRYGDSIETLKTLVDPIDIFINDSDHSAEYEAREYETIADKLSPSAIVLGDNAHVSDALQKFSERHQRAFLFFQEPPKRHWYRGGGIGFSFKREPS